MRAISDVATAVTKGDLTRSINVEAQGEVASLKDNINQMIVNLKETTQKNTEQDWLKTNLAKFSSMMQGQKNLEAGVADDHVGADAAGLGAPRRVLHDGHRGGDAPILKLTSSYAYRERKSVANRFRLGEGLVGQCALEKKTILLTNAPPDYIQISSGLGEATPLNIIVLPVLFEGEVKAVIELASFHPFSAIHQHLPRPAHREHRRRAQHDQRQHADRGAAAAVAEADPGAAEPVEGAHPAAGRAQAHQLGARAAGARAGGEGEAARGAEHQGRGQEPRGRAGARSLEEKAEQLALISKYKSEFLANMSHELRTPLNSLLILAKLLSDNKEANLTEKQVEYAKTIHASGGDLLDADQRDPRPLQGRGGQDAGRAAPAADPSELADFVERSFRPWPSRRGSASRSRSRRASRREIRTDRQRLQQVLKNLLANAFKFTESGSVTFRVELAAAAA